MGSPRTKLLILSGPHVDPDAVDEALAGAFQVIRASPEEALETLEREGCQAILAEAGDYVALERDLVGRQSSMLLDAIGEGVCLWHSSGRVLWANRLFREYDNAVQRRIERACARGAERFLARNADAEAGLPMRMRVDLEKRGLHFEAMVSPVRTEHENGSGALVVAVVRDVSSPVKLERRIDAIHRAGRELAYLEADEIRKLHAPERLRLLQERLVRVAHELLHFDHIVIRQLNPKSNELELVMAKGIPEEARNIRLLAEDRGNGISGYVASTGVSYISNDTTSDPNYVYGLDTPGSSLTVPLRVFDRVVGTFNIESEERDAFDETDRKLAEILAGYVASALHTLNLLVVERFTTSEAATGTVHGEISGPLNDLAAEVELLRKSAGDDPEASPHLERILRDVSSIRRRIKNVARGSQTLLGAEELVEAGRVDPALQGRRVLVADNEESVRDLMRDVLTAVGCLVVTCDDGVSAIRLLETWRLTHDAEEAFDLVVSDINLGDKTGYEVFSSAKLASEALPVVLMTGFGYDPHHSIVRATQEGLQAVLFKPFQADRLVEEVRKAIVGDGAAAEGAEDASGDAE
jgi:CheY-like chemotaxis protein/PAS domain-containing protein